MMPPNAPISEKERTRLLPSLTNRGQLEQIERLSINAARVWVMRAAVLKREDLLTEAFARELHRRMFRGIWRDAGRYRTTKRNPGWEPKRIAEGVRLILDDAEAWFRFGTYPVHEAAVRLHQRLVSLHPWSNGNGRHARLMADVVVASHGEAPLAWGSRGEAGAPGSARPLYLEAMRQADAGNFGPLLEFAGG
jgi:Fic-DOC domain mobile mystery protein B